MCIQLMQDGTILLGVCSARLQLVDLHDYPTPSKDVGRQDLTFRDIPIRAMLSCMSDARSRVEIEHGQPLPFCATCSIKL